MRLNKPWSNGVVRPGSSGRRLPLAAVLLQVFAPCRRLSLAAVLLCPLLRTPCCRLPAAVLLQVFAPCRHLPLAAVLLCPLLHTPCCRLPLAAVLLQVCAPRSRLPLATSLWLLFSSKSPRRGAAAVCRGAAAAALCRGCSNEDDTYKDDQSKIIALRSTA